MPARSLHILLVEDHADTLASLLSYLDSLGHTVSPARNMKEALGKLSSDHFDFLLSDIGLPDGTGWELLKKAHVSDLYCVAMSGFAGTVDGVRSREAGYRYHLVKPFDPQKLEEILDQAMVELPTPLH